MWNHIYPTGTCGQDPVLLLFFFSFFFYKIFFLTSTFFHLNNILQLSMYHCTTNIVFRHQQDGGKKRPISTPPGKCVLCYCRCFIEMCALIP
jgi:hypothetical protein